ncbi:hypothetical protein KKH43_03365, partial [Patescibacteria group bacterium]|nr:hypothetical protein [Patescibacteria group bacterium]
MKRTTYVRLIILALIATFSLVIACSVKVSDKNISPEFGEKSQSLDCGGQDICSDEYNGRRYRLVNTTKGTFCRHRKLVYEVTWEEYNNGLHYFLAHTRYADINENAGTHGPSEAWTTGFEDCENNKVCLYVLVPTTLMWNLFGSSTCDNNKAREVGRKLQLELKKDFKGTYGKCDPRNIGCMWDNVNIFFARNDVVINFHYWGHSSPHPGVLPNDFFRVRWERYIIMQDGLHRFYAKADDGVRVYLRMVKRKDEINKRSADRADKGVDIVGYPGRDYRIHETNKSYKIVDSWRNQVAEFRPEVCLSAGKYHIVIDYYEFTEGAQMIFDLGGKPVSGCGNSAGGMGGPGGSVPSGTHCVPRQIICADKWHQRSCSSSGQWLPAKHCPNGCFQNQCNFCKLGSTRCKDRYTEQRCAPNGKSYYEKQCIHRCMNGHCVFQVPCKPNQQVCKDTGVLLTCAYNGSYWSQTRCKNGCSHNQCRFCWPFMYRCKSITTEQVCSTDGKRYIDQQCVHRCDTGRCMFKLPCKPGQKVCKDTSTQITCSSDGKQWIKTPCSNGCSNNKCNFCKPWTYLCKDSTTEQVCSPDGSRYIDQLCIKRCDKGRCFYKIPCKPKQVLCVDTKTQLTCSTDGQTWTKKSCSHGCGPWTCKPDPSSAQTCTPSIRRCINKTEVQLCMSDGSKWVPQYTCQNSCTEGICQNQSYQCTISFDSQARKMS